MYVRSPVVVNGSRVDITLRKETPHKQWETLGSYLPGHGQLIAKNDRGMLRQGGRGEGGGRGREASKEWEGSGENILLSLPT